MNIVKNEDGTIDIIKLVEAKLEDGSVVTILDERNKTFLKPGQLEAEIETLQLEISGLQSALTEKQLLLIEINKK